MNIFLLSFGVFIINFTHLVSATDGLRSKLISRYSRRNFYIAHGIASSVALLMIIYGFSERDFIVIYEPPIWSAHFNKSIMFFSVWLFVGDFFNGYIKKLTKAPTFAAIGLWSLGHLCANGDLYSVILFGGFLLLVAGFLLLVLTGLYDNWRKPAADTTYHYKYDLYAFGIAIIAYTALVIAHPYISGINIF